MPTIATRPSLETTQAVGALLLHQFARERFLEAGIDEHLICEAEEREHLNALADTLLHDENSNNETRTDLDSNLHNMSSTSSRNGKPHSSSNTPSRSEVSVHQDGDVSRNVTSNTSYQTSTNETTIRGDGLSDGQRTHDDLFHSIAESSTNGTPQRADKSIYHSMNVSGQQASSSPFERLQSSPGLASYGRELRRIAEEFEKSRLRKNVKERAGQVNLHDITKESFVKLLEELFQEKITREKIVILFFFCTDVALRAALSAQELVVKLLGWSFSYIVNTVCSFVYKLGGWDKVLFYNFIFYQLPSLMVTCCAVLAIVWLGIGIRRTLQN